MYIHINILIHVLIYKFRYVRTVHFENTKLKERHCGFMSPTCPSSFVLPRDSPDLLCWAAAPARQGSGNRCEDPRGRCHRRSCWSCSGCRPGSAPAPGATVAAAAAAVAAVAGTQRG